MGRFDGYLFCTDIDGTLVNSEGKISAANYKKIEEFKREGGLFTVATGRFPDHIGTLGVEVNAPVIAVNGTIIYDTKAKKTLRSTPIKTKYEDVVAFLFNKHINTLKNAEACGAWDSVSFDVTTPLPEILNGFSDYEKYKFVFRCNTQKGAEKMINDLKSLYGSRFRFDRAWPTGVEMHASDSGKGECAVWLKEYLACVHTVVGAGDYENDVCLLKLADIGYAVENACEDAKRAADRMAPDHNSDAVAYIIDDLK